VSWTIHPSAVVDPGASLGADCSIGPFSVVEAGVTLGRGCRIHGHVTLYSGTRLGDQCEVFPGAVLGGAPQHLRYAGEPTQLEIGNRVTIRESVTLHRGTAFGRRTTSVGDDSLLMAYVHVGHDCVVGSNVTIANATQLAGHVEVHDYATLGGLSAVPQFLRVGRHVFMGGCSIARKDIPPFISGKGNEFRAQGINKIGLARRGVPDADIADLRRLFKIIYLRNLPLVRAIEISSADLGKSELVREFLSFIRDSKSGIVR